jgi:hypothetical protein
MHHLEGEDEQKWLRDIKAKNPSIKVVPRLLLNDISIIARLL